jgi:alkanesulfonate monooxygenase SsuD/methylene tetrahydromethanopterin reductase-like flavin-dependent oxidoreductase (luciferase family)
LELLAQYGTFGWGYQAAMELGITTFAEITDPSVSPGERLRQVIAEAKLADELGLEVYGIGEHHRPDMAASAPEIVLATIAGCTKTIKLSSAVIVQLGRSSAGVPGLCHARSRIGWTR